MENNPVRGNDELLVCFPSSFTENWAAQIFLGRHFRTMNVTVHFSIAERRLHGTMIGARTGRFIVFSN